MAAERFKPGDCYIPFWDAGWYSRPLAARSCTSNRCMQVGSLVVSWITTPLATWTAMIILLTVHLSMNYAAVRAVSMRSLNRQRANIVLSHLLEYDEVLTPQEVSKRERIFERDGVLRWTHDRVIGYGIIGVSLERLMQGLGQSHKGTRSVHLQGGDFARLLDVYRSELYLLWFDPTISTIYVVLKRGSTPQTHLKAWCQGLLVAQKAATQNENQSEILGFDAIIDTYEQMSKRFDEHFVRLKAAGWDVDVSALETRSGTRIERKQ